jgi:hypothetical protein
MTIKSISIFTEIISCSSNFVQYAQMNMKDRLIKKSQIVSGEDALSSNSVTLTPTEEAKLDSIQSIKYCFSLPANTGR